MFQNVRGINGTMPFRAGVVQATIVGGPYRNLPQGMVGVKMAKEINAPCAVDIPTQDFSVPDPRTLRLGLMKAILLILEGKQLYVGCMGGIGRTGLFLGALVKVMSEYRKIQKKGWIDPKTYVRKHYIPHAIETEQQEEYLNDLYVADIARWLWEYQRVPANKVR